MTRRAAALVLAAALAACKEKATPQGVPVEGTVGPYQPPAGGQMLVVNADVEVIYDGLGMPHIYAQSDEDGAFAMGYLHARDRLFEMDFVRRAGRGKLSELVGEAALSEDVALRTVFTGIRPDGLGGYQVGRVEDLIAQDLANTAPQVHAVLQRYADGVNRFLRDLAAGENGARLPAEYLVLPGGLSPPAEWTVEDSIAMGRYFTWSLSFDTNDLDVGRAALAFGCAPPVPTFACAMLADLTRSAPAVASVILPPQAPPPLQPIPGAAAASVRGAAAGAASLRALLGQEKAGSNNWVVSGSRTATGKPLLANDPHLALQNPAIFYLVQLSTPSRNVAGVSFPGAPIVEIGHDGKVAWGNTVAGYDVTDYFLETFDAQGRVLHRAPGEPAATYKPIQVLSETFGVAGTMAGCPAPCTVTVPIPVVPWHGPVLLDSISGTSAVSVQWTGQNPTQEVLAFWQLNSASTVDDAFQALAWFDVGAQNVVLADTAGNIGYDPHAWVPIRPAGCIPWAPMPGDGRCDWTGRIADADLPQARNPSAGWVATANNDITGSTVDNNPLTSPAPYPPAQYLYYTADLGYRHARVAQRLTEKSGGYSLDDMTSIQADVHSLFAEALVPALLAWWSSMDCVATDVAGTGDCAAAIADLGLKPAADLLSAWAAAGPQRYRTPTGLATANPAGAASSDASERQAAAASMLFHALVPRLARLVLDDDLAPYGYSVTGTPAAGGSPALASWFDSQVVAKYLVALGEGALFTYGLRPQPAIPLNTGEALCAGPLTDSCADAAVLALQEAVAFLSTRPEFASATPSDWLWGRLHRAVFSSYLPGAAVFDYGPFANDGGLYTVDVANFSWSDDGPGGFVQHDGPNVRFAAQVGSGSIAWRAVIPGGESGFAGDPNYMDQIPAWLANQKGDQPYARSEVEAAAIRTLMFTP